MALMKTFATNAVLTAADVNEFLAHQVPNPGDPFDTGWLPLTPLNDFEASSNEMVRRIGMVIYFQGRISGDLPASTNYDVARSPFSVSAAFATSAATTGGQTNIFLYMAPNGIIRLRSSAPLTSSFYLHELSGAIAA